MNYGTVFSNVYGGITLINGEFDIERVMRVTEEYCPVDFTEEEVNEIALAVLDKLLADGVVYIDSIDEKDQKIAYKTIFSFEHKQEEQLEPAEKTSC